MTEWRPLWDADKEKREIKTAIDDLPPPGSCEFVGSLVDPTITARVCFDRTFCPARVFSDPKIFGSCPARLEKLHANRAKTALQEVIE